MSEDILSDAVPLAHEVALGQDDGPKSLSDQMRERRAEIAEVHECFLPVTGYEQFGLVAKHRLMDRSEVEKIARRIMHETKDRGERNIRILLDIIINSTTGFYLQNDEMPDDPPKPILDDRSGDSPVLNWSMFAFYLGWKPSDGDGDARSAVYWIFAGNEFMIGSYGINLNRWMNNTGVKVDEEFLGETL
jgi:hypothetical protein